MTSRIDIRQMYSSFVRMFSFPSSTKHLKMTPENEYRHNFPLVTKLNLTHSEDPVVIEEIEIPTTPQTKKQEDFESEKTFVEPNKIETQKQTAKKKCPTPRSKKQNILKKLLLPAATIAIILSGEHQTSTGMGQISTINNFEHTFHDAPPVFDDMSFKQHVAGMVLHEWENRGDDEEDDEVSFLYAGVRDGLASKFFGGVRKLTECTGGVYLFPGGGIFKPMEEEVLGDSQLSIGFDHPQRAGFKIGEGAIREVAAYLIDKANGGFSGVPTTCLVSVDRQLIHTKETGLMTGSLQKFIAYESSSEDMGQSSFETGNVHKIALLDLRLFNTDRHGGNLLVTTDKSLVPIDHGLCLPDVRELGEAWFEWLPWEHCKRELSKEAVAWVHAIDIERDADILRRLEVRPEAILTLYVTTYLLKCAVQKGWTLFEIGTFMQRPSLDPHSRSDLEILIQRVVSSSEILSSSWKTDPAAVFDDFLKAYVAELPHFLDKKRYNNGIVCKSGQQKKTMISDIVDIEEIN